MDPAELICRNCFREGVKLDRPANSRHEPPKGGFLSRGVLIDPKLANDDAEPTIPPDFAHETAQVP